MIMKKDKSNKKNINQNNNKIIGLLVAIIILLLIMIILFSISAIKIIKSDFNNQGTNSQPIKLNEMIRSRELERVDNIDINDGEIETNTPSTEE